jgi:hypothetical protein
MKADSMRLLARLSLLAAGIVLLGGCAFMSDEDRDFYGKGWVNPRELDQPAHHPIPNPEAGPESAPAVTTPTTRSDGDGWTAPPLN